MEEGWKKILEVFVVLILILVILMIVFAGLQYGFKILRNQISSNVILHGKPESNSIDNGFKIILSLGFIFLMVFILSQVIATSRKTLKRVFSFK
jgi:hypothetical protein